MNFREIRYRITALLMLATFTFTSISAYAEVPDEVVIEETVLNEDNADSSDSGESEPEAAYESSDDTQVLEVTVTLLSETEPKESPEEISEVTDNTESVAAEAPAKDNSDGVDPETVNPENVNPEAPAADESAPADEGTEPPASQEADSAGASVGQASDNDSLNGQLMTEEFKDLEDGNRTLYSKTISSVSTSQSSTGRLNVSYIVTEKNESTGEEKNFQYTISGFKSEEDILTFLNYVGITSAASTDTRYLYSDNNLIDAEKKIWEYKTEIETNPDADPKDDYDSNHCWAGAASNMLVLSGWNKADSIDLPDGYDFEDEDSVFDYFTHYYDDNAGNSASGIKWFFSGINETEDRAGWSHLKNEDKYTASLLKDYCSQNFTDYNMYPDETGLLDLLKALDEDSDGDRCALGLVVGYYKTDENGKTRVSDDNRDGGHCITIVGYSTDENGLPASLVIADSDSYNSDGVRITSSKYNDERAYKNTYTVYPLKYYDGYWHMMNYYEGDKYDNIIDEIDYLKYYSDNTKYKVEQYGTKDLINYPDLNMWYLYTFKDGLPDYDCDTVYEGEGLNLEAAFTNFSTVCTNLGTNTISYRIEITQDGTVISSNDYSVELEDSNFSSGLVWNRFVNENSNLVAGEYTVRFIINPDGTITEAYYNNNSTGMKFVILKRIDSSGNEHYEIISEDDNDDNNADNNDEDASVPDAVKDVVDYSVIEDQSVFINNPLKTFDFNFKSGLEDLILTDADLTNAELSFSLSLNGGLLGSGKNTGENLTIKKDDYAVVRNADGTISIVFSNAFMRKLPKGTHYFRMLIGGKIRTFKIEIK